MTAPSGGAGDGRAGQFGSVRPIPGGSPPGRRVRGCRRLHRHHRVDIAAGSDVPDQGVRREAASTEVERHGRRVPARARRRCRSLDLLEPCSRNGSRSAAIRVPRRATNTAVVFGAGNVRSRSRWYLRIAVIVVGWSGMRRDLPNFVSVTRTQPLPSPASSALAMSSSLRVRASLIRIPVTVSSPDRSGCTKPRSGLIAITLQRRDPPA